MACRIYPIDHRYTEYLSDESRKAGQAESISFPENEAEVRDVVARFSGQRIPVTVQGSRTGLCGGGVPAGGHILNLSKMDKVTGLGRDSAGKFTITVQPGVRLQDLNRLVSEKRFNTDTWDASSLDVLKSFEHSAPQFWPPDPSEKTAGIGGIAATDARGICAYRYGTARRHINRIRVADAGGGIHDIARGQYCFEKGRCPLPGGRTRTPASGSFVFETADTADLIDLYLGSEGMLGPITGLELCLEPRPAEIWGVAFFFPAEHGAAGFIRVLTEPQGSPPDSRIAAIEFMDQKTLQIINASRRTNSDLQALPALGSGVSSAVLIEIHSDAQQPVETLAEKLMALAQRFDGDPDQTWAFCNEREMERFHLFRHAAPESVNAHIDRARRKDPRIYRLETGFQLSLPISEHLEMYRDDLQKNRLSAAVFGHAGDGLLHVGMLPDTYSQYVRAAELAARWADRFLPKHSRSEIKERVGKECKNGIGSGPLPRQREMMLTLKAMLDPHDMWNPGHMRD